MSEKPTYEEPKRWNRELEQPNSKGKQAEKLLPDSEEPYCLLFNDILDSMAVGIFILDADFKVVWINHALERYFGLNRDTVIGKAKRQIIQEQIKDIFEEPDSFIERVFAAYEDNTYIEKFECHVLPDGKREERWLEHWSQPIKSGLYAGGRIEHYTDISDRKQTEEDLQEQKNRQDYILVGTNVGTWEWNIQTGETIFNERWAEIIGYNLKELSPISIDTWIKHTRPDDLKTSDEILQRHFNGELDYYECECRMKHKDGHWVWILDRGKVISWTDDGRPLWMFGTHADITPRKQAEKDLRNSRNMLKTVLDCIPSAVFWKDKDLNYLGGNRAFLEAVGLKSSEDIIGKNDYYLSWEKQQANSYRKHDRRVIASGTPEYNIIEILSPS